MAPARRGAPGEAPAMRLVGDDERPGLPALPLAPGAAWRAALLTAADAAVTAVIDADARVPAAALRVGTTQLCAGVERALAGLPVGRIEVAPALPLGALARALRRDLLAQARAGTLAPHEAIALCEALERVDDALADCPGHRFAARLGGDGGLALLVDVAHDMRSPLGSILFLVEQLRRGHSGPVTPVQERQLGLVYGAALGLSELASDVMDLARGGDMLVAGEQAPFSIPALFAQVQQLLVPVAEERRLALVLETPITGARLGHGGAVQRVLLNLATNALKFTDEGEVRVEAQPLGASRVHFTVRDTGRGIPEALVGSLFDAFRRRLQPGEYVFSSAGLGLSICQVLVRAMGGELLVETAPGKGTAFHFELELPAQGRGG
jgi:signal transduction histidine kinase